MPTSVAFRLENLAKLEETYASCLGGETSDASKFVKRMIIHEYERDKNDPNLFAVYLKLCGNNHPMDAVRLVDADLKPLFKAIRTKPCITVLDLRYNRLTDQGALLIAGLLKDDELIEELNLVGNDIGEQGATEIASALKVNQKLVVLKMTGNPIGPTGGIRLAQALQINRTLEFLDIGECDQTITSCIAFATMLRQNNSIRSLNMNRQLLWTQQEEPTVHIADMLRVNTALRELHLAKVNMLDFGAQRLADALHSNQTLQLLDVSGNRIARDGAFALSRVLAMDSPLVILDLAFNRIQCPGAKAIAAALVVNTTLKVLAVQHCELKGPGLCSLAESLITNNTLSNIYIWGNEYDESTCIAFSNLLKTERLTENGTDVRPYVVDGKVCLARLDNDNEYRLYRFTVPSCGGFFPRDRSIALF